MTGIILIITMAIITEALVEYGKTIAKGFSGKDIKTAMTQIAAIIISVLLCFAAGADLFRLAGISFTQPWIGTLLTGILGSRGSNYMSDLLSKIQKK